MLIRVVSMARLAAMSVSCLSLFCGCHAMIPRSFTWVNDEHYELH
jgi:hypothetical protein